MTAPRKKLITIDSEQQVERILELVELRDPIYLPGAKRLYIRDTKQVVVRVPGDMLCDKLRAAIMRERANMAGGQVVG